MTSGLDKLHVQQDNGVTRSVAEAGVPGTAPDDSAMTMTTMMATMQDAGMPKQSEIKDQGMAKPMSDELSKPDAAVATPAAAAPDAGSLDAGNKMLPPVSSRGPVVTIAGAAAPPSGAGGKGMTAADGGSGAMMSDPSAGSPAPAGPACKLPTPAGNQCIVAPQCGCGDDENCTLSDEGDVSCAAAGGTPENYPCKSSQECKRGYACLDNNCMELCDGKNPSCKNGASACFQVFHSAKNKQGAPIPEAFACESNCDPLRPDRPSGQLNACGPGTTCWVSATGTSCAGSLETRGQGEVCSHPQYCAPGFACRNDTHTCAKWCLSSSDCPSNFSCDLSDATTAGTQKLGVCNPNCEFGEQVCSVTSQCGCDANHGCNVSAYDTQSIHVCRDNGTVPPNAACTDFFDCTRGYACVGNECRRNCLTGIDCSRYERCEATTFADEASTSAGSYCSRPCDPADALRAHGNYGACAPDQACSVTAAGDSYCRRASLSGSVGSACRDDTQCGTGTICLDTGYCAALCRNTSECSAGSCLSFSTKEYARDVEWGYCAQTSN